MSLPKIYALFLIAFSFGHIIIGSNMLLVVLCLFIGMAGLWHCNKDSLYFSDIFMLVLSVYTGVAPLVFKLFLLQPLQSNLESPIMSAIMIFMGYISLSFASVFARPKGERVWYGNAYIVNSLKNPSVIRYMAPITASLGVFFFILHVIFRPVLTGDELVGKEGFGGFGSFYFLLLLGIAMFAYSYKHFGLRKDAVFLLILAPIVVGLSVFANVKKNMFDMLWIFVLSYFSFGFVVNKKILALCGLVSVLIVLYVSPIIHLMRTNFAGQGLIERGESFFQILQDYEYDPLKLRQAEAAYIEGFEYSFNPKNSYVFPSNLNLDRFFLLKTTDRVISSSDVDSGAIGIGPFLQLALEGILPSLLIEKSLYVGADLVGWEYGIVHINSIARPVIGYYASAYAAEGLLGLLLFPWIIFFPAFYFMNKFVGSFRQNVFAVLMLAMASQLAEKEIDAFLVAFVRDYVFIYFGLWGIILFSEFCINSNPWRTK